MYSHYGYDAETFVGDAENHGEEFNEEDGQEEYGHIEDSLGESSNEEDNEKEYSNGEDESHEREYDSEDSHERTEYSNGYNNGAEDSQAENIHEEYSNREHSSGEGSHESAEHSQVEHNKGAEDSHEPGVEESREPRTSTPVAATCNLQTMSSSPAKTPNLPRYLSGRKNWRKRESDPAVRDFLVNNEDMQTPRKRRKIKPRNIYTPSAYN